MWGLRIILRSTMPSTTTHTHTHTRTQSNGPPKDVYDDGEDLTIQK